MTEKSHTGSIVLLTRLARLVYRRSPESLLGIHLKQLSVLAYLRDYGRITQQALSEGLCTDANTCVLLLNELETADYVERRRDPADRRRHIVEITPAGLEALEHAELAQGTVEDDVLSALDEQERETLRLLLTRALEGPQAPAAAPGAPVAVVGA
jgi:DNA-binding MarR family transcriptional regulator